MRRGPSVARHVTWHGSTPRAQLRARSRPFASQGSRSGRFHRSVPAPRVFISRYRPASGALLDVVASNVNNEVCTGLRYVSAQNSDIATVQCDDPSICQIKAR